MKVNSLTLLSRIWILVPVLLLALGLRLAETNGHNLWYDEAVELDVATQPLPELIAADQARTYDPPLFSLALNVWTQLGRTDFQVRFFPIFASVLATAVMFVLGCTYFSTATGWFSALFMAVAPRSVYYGFELNQYAFVLLLSALDLLLLERYLRYPTIGRLTALVLAGVITIFTHYEMASYLVALVLVGTSALLLNGAAKKRWRVLVYWLSSWSVAAMVSILLLWLYALPQEKLRPHATASIQFAGLISFPTQIETWVVKTEELMRTLLWGFQPIPFALITTGLLIAGVVVALFRPASRRLAYCFVISLIAAYLMSGVGFMLYYHRYVLFALPLGILLICGGAFSLAEGRFRGYLLPITCVVFTALAILLIRTLPTVSGIPYPETEQFGEVMQVFQARYQPDDGVYVYYGAKPAFKHYATEAQLEAAVLQPWARGDNREKQQAAFWSAMEGKARVWLLMSHVDPSDASFLPEALRSRCQQIDELEAINSSGYLFECTN